MTDTSDTTSHPAAPLSDWEMEAVARAKLSIGAETGLSIGVQKGPLCLGLCL